MKKYIDAAMIRKMFLAGTKYLYLKKELINDLNVFPVPDGDTGTNMTLTLMSAVKELSATSDSSMSETGNRISAGTLRGARGNSGVIMSQLCRGFVKAIEDKNKLYIDDFVTAFGKASATAYNAVLKPQEGTILTVARAVFEKASAISERDLSLDEFFSEILNHAEYILSQTPNMLPVLKEAGVVDSGGQGLVEFLRGAHDAFRGVDIDLTFDEHDDKGKQSVNVDTSNIETANIKFGYCTEFIIELSEKYDENDDRAFKAFLESSGDSVVCVNMDNIVKVHVHTNHPGEVIEKALSYGQLLNMKIDNMRFEHHERIIRDSEKENNPDQDEPLKPLGFVTVCTGDGITNIFMGLNVDRIIEGGQTMNPSTEDILEAVNMVKASSVFIIPNNKNIVMSAEQVRDLCRDKDIFVIPTDNICQGINAMINYDPSKGIPENLKDMSEAARMIKSGEVTYAVRSTKVNDKKIKKGDYMGIGEGEILAVSKDLNETAVEMVKALADEDTELITVYYGAGTKEEKAVELRAKLEEILPDADIDLAYGGQKVYNYFISAE